MIQREEGTDSPETAPPVTPAAPPKTASPAKIDWSAVNKVYFDRGLGKMDSRDSGLIQWRWSKTYNLGLSFGLSSSVAEKTSNILTPLYIDAGLSHDNPTIWDTMDRQLGTSSIIFSPTVMTFDLGNFGKTVDSPLRSLFGGKARNPYPSEPSGSVQRKCDDCEQEENIQKKSGDPGMLSASGSIENGLSAASGQGAKLPATTKIQMESAFGADFSSVRVHTNSTAVNMNQDLGAQAFTHGSDIYFNQSRYNTTSTDGKRLLAHELTHVVQNGNSEAPKLRRRTQTGFEIRGIYPNAGAYPNTIFYEMGSAMIPPSEWYKVPAIATAFAGKPIKITGTASEEGDDVTNLAVINRRISGVHQVLQNAGHRLPHTRNPQPGVTAGNKDYRQVRNVEVEEMIGTLPPGGTPPSTVDPCDTTLNPHPEIEPCGTAVFTAFPLGLAWILGALVKLNAPDAATTTQAGILFPGIPIPTITTNVRSLLGKFSGLLSSHVCHNHCDPACSRPARMATSTGIMTVCPGFLDEPNITKRAKTLIHESLHATPGVMSQDIAYLSTRLITSLTGAQALRNTDSYVLLIFSLNGLVPPSAPPIDTFDPTLSPAEKTSAQNALAFLEQWLLWSQYDTSLLYSAINKNIGRAGGWDPADNNSASLLHKISPHFTLTDPGAAAPYPTAPVPEDRSKMAGMFDRYNRMMYAVYQRNLDVHKSGVSRWQPGIGTRIDLANAFFAMGPEAATRFLLTLLIRADGTVPATLVNAYVEGANEFRTRWGAGP